MSTARDALLRHFEASRGARAAQEPVWLSALREDAIASFRETGLPTTRHEDWRFTDLSALAALELIEASEAPELSASWVDATHKAVGAEHRLVFSNGLFRREHSLLDDLPASVRVRSIAEVLAREPERLEGKLGACADVKASALAALNTGLFADGAFVEIAEDAAIEQAIHLVFVQTGGDEHVAAHPRILITAGARARATVVEHYIGGDPHSGLSNPLTEIMLERDASVHHVTLQERRSGSFHLASLWSRQEAASRFASHSIAIGEGLSRVEIRALLAGEGAHVDMDGLYLARGKNLVDHHTTIDHAMPHTTSKELYKGILDERGHGVFHGRVHVRPDAQRIDARQTNRALLLSDGARINTKPQLEIYADDVKCSHGATVGQLDEDQLFYLRTRGMDAAQARAVLTGAFASEVVDALPLQALRRYLRYAILRWLPETVPA